MAISSPDAKTEAPALTPQVPNFREDERLQERYVSMLQRRIKTFAMEHESSIRRNASAKRDELREEQDEAQAEWQRRTTTFEAAREAYRTAYPDHVKKTRLVEPSVVENVRSLGAAKKLYQAAMEAWRAAEHATSNLRRIEHNENQLDIELKKALERAPQVSKEVTESAKWLAEIHAEEELGAAKAKVDEIAAERESYEKRLGAGAVPDEERRLRTFAGAGIKHAELPSAGLMCVRIDRFGPKTYFILRDLRKQLYALPYDRRLEPILDGVFDIARSGEGFAARRTTRENSRIPLTLREHFQKCADNDEAAAQDAYGRHQEFLREFRSYETMSECDETEAKVIELLAQFAAEQTR